MKEITREQIKDEVVRILAKYTWEYRAKKNDLEDNQEILKKLKEKGLVQITSEYQLINDCVGSINYTIKENLGINSNIVSYNDIKEDNIDVGIVFEKVCNEVVDNFRLYEVKNNKISIKSYNVVASYDKEYISKFHFQTYLSKIDILFNLGIKEYIRNFVQQELKTGVKYQITDEVSVLVYKNGKIVITF